MKMIVLSDSREKEFETCFEDIDTFIYSVYSVKLIYVIQIGLSFINEFTNQGFVIVWWV